MTFLVPRPSKCPECQGGRVGMDHCKTCAATGTVFRVSGKMFPDTREGYARAEAELNPPVGGEDLGYFGP